MMGFKENIEERKLNVEDVFVASFLAGLNEFGILNQAVMNIASRRVGKYLAMFEEVKNPIKINESKGIEEQCEQALTSLNSTLFISSDINIEKEYDNIVVKIRNSKCKFCPKGVGEAELEGTICPFPGLIEEFINHFCNKKVKIMRVDNKILRKEDDWCVMKYEVA
jgi:predicted hydrocarbon binding protein